MPNKLTDGSDPILVDIEHCIGGSVASDISAKSCELNPPTLACQKDWARVEKALKAENYKVEVLDWQDIHDGPADPKTGVAKVVGKHPKHVIISW